MRKSKKARTTLAMTKNAKNTDIAVNAARDGQVTTVVVSSFAGVGAVGAGVGGGVGAGVGGGVGAGVGASVSHVLSAVVEPAVQMPSQAASVYVQLAQASLLLAEKVPLVHSTQLLSAKGVPVVQKDPSAQEAALAFVQLAQASMLLVAKVPEPQ